MCTLDKEALFLGLEKSCYKEAILFHKSSQVCFPREVLSASLLFRVPQVLISGKNPEGTLVCLIQFTADDRGIGVRSKVKDPSFWRFRLRLVPVICTRPIPVVSMLTSDFLEQGFSTFLTL